MSVPVYSHNYSRLYHRGFCRLQSNDHRRRVRQRISAALWLLAFVAVLCVVGNLP